VRVAAAAFVAAAIFLGGVMVGLGSGDDGDQEVPVAIALVDEGTSTTPGATDEEKTSNVKKVEHPAKHGEVDDNSGPGGGKAEYWEDDSSGPGSGGDDSSGPGSEDDSSGSGSGGDDNSGSGSSSSGSGSDGSGDSSGPG
jgi:hypothetical protein